MNAPTNASRKSPSAADLLDQNIATARELLDAAANFASPLEEAAQLLRDALLRGHKLLCCGNGGSAADAAHFSSEITGRYVLNRPGFPGIDLTADHSVLTALINDYPAAEVFARQVRALGAPADVLAAFSTSGQSDNVHLALEAGRERGLKTVAFLGRDGGKCRGLADVEFIVPSQTTARIQEVHQLLYHTLCEVLDPVLAEAGQSQQV